MSGSICPDTLRRQTEAHFQAELRSLQFQTDAVFFWLLLAQWVFSIICALIVSPYTWKGDEYSIHIHVWTAILLGGAITSLPVWLIHRGVQSRESRWVVASAQVLFSSLLIHIMGGRIEAHFHVFGSLAILSFYRDNTVYIPAVGIILVDHVARGLFWPESVFGVVTPNLWRAFEHGGWIAFETVFLVWGIQQSRHHLRRLSKATIWLNSERATMESRVGERTQELEESKQLLKTILDSLPIEISMLDEHGNIISTNASWDNFAKSNQGGSSCFHGNYLEICRNATGSCRAHALNIANAIEGIIESGRGMFLSEYECHSPSEDRWFQIMVSPINSPIWKGAVVTHISITQRVLAELETKRQQQEASRLALVARYTDNAVIITDSQSRIEWVNHAFTRMSGYTMAEVKGKSPGAFLRGEKTAPETVEIMRESMVAQKGFDVEILNYTKNGRTYWAEIESRPIYDEYGNVEKYIAVQREITDKKAREKNLSLLRTALESGKDGMLLVEGSGKIVDANRMASQLLGWDRPELLKKHFRELVPDSIRRDAEQMTLWNGSNAFESTVKTRGGDDRVVDVLSTAFQYDGSSYHCLLMRDAGARIESENEKRKLTDELQIAARHAGMAEIANGVLHNIGNILNSINVSVSEIDKLNDQNIQDRLSKLNRMLDEFDGSFVDFVNQDQRGLLIPKYLQAITHSLDKHRKNIKREIADLRENVDHVKEVVNAQQSMATSGSLAQNFSLSELIHSAMIAARGSLSQNGVKTVVDMEDENLVLRSDKHKLLQILVNLIKNASDALQESETEDPQILIETRFHNHDLAIRVRDNGCGIPRNMLERIFNHGVTTKKHGHGFGLHSSANSASELGGSLTASSEGPGKGSCFELLIPGFSSGNPIQYPVELPHAIPNATL